MQALERSFQENMAQLKNKLEREREILLREQEIMLEHKLKVSLDGPWAVPDGQTLVLRKGRTKVLTKS